ncbi:MAG: sodium:solute symporter [Cyclobacteriaceae bacterium]
MNVTTTIALITSYFLVLVGIAFLTSKKASNATFFTGDKSSPWYVVAFGMIGASLSGVTFISVPGWVMNANFAYMQMVLGYLVGYFVIANVLLPLYYKLQLTSIYSYLETRFGFWSYKVGATYFIISRIIGASFRLFLVSNVLQLAVFDSLHIPYQVTVFITIALIWVYTFKGGIKTVVWTDTLQTFFMLLALALTLSVLSSRLDWSFTDLITNGYNSSYSTIFQFNDYTASNFFVKQFLAGAFIAIVMTGLDQDMMQKNLSCRTLKDAQKNMLWFSIVLVVVNLFFLLLGYVLITYSTSVGISLPDKGDDLFPLLALQELGPFISAIFILGVIAAAYSSADSALTSLTTSFCVDFLGTDRTTPKKRYLIHFGFSIVLFLVILAFKQINNDSVIANVFRVAGYTYGPLLGLYSFGLFTKKSVKDKWVPLVCILAPVLTYAINSYSAELLNGYTFGFELLLLNGGLTFLGLVAISKK